MIASNLSGHVQRFFTERLTGQLGASPHTVASYRDTFRLLLVFASKHRRRPASDLRLEDLDAKLVAAFLRHLEHDRGNGARSRNNRLSAIHAFFRQVYLQEPALAHHCQQVLAVPFKRFERGPVGFLSADESVALLNAPDTTTWRGRRDRLLLQLALQTGLRSAELIGLHRQDVHLGVGPHVRCLGKGRKARCTPLRPEVAKGLSQWLAQEPQDPIRPLFPTATGKAMSADALQKLVSRHVRIASTSCPSLRLKRVTPHTLRHTTAMDLLHRGVDIAVIALWLGHDSLQSTQAYLHADMAIKERALGRANPGEAPLKRYRPKDRLLAFLEAL